MIGIEVVLFKKYLGFRNTAGTFTDELLRVMSRICFRIIIAG